MRELKMLVRVRHPLIVGILEWFETGAPHGKESMHLVLEYVPRNLHQCIQSTAGGMAADDVRCFAFQLLRVLAHLGGLEICHRDLKPENVLVNGRALKVADLGSAKQIRPGEPSTSYICSRWWRAPELLLGTAQYTTSVDRWSCGCVIAEMMRGEALFKGASSVDQFRRIFTKIGSPTSEELRSLRPGGGEALYTSLQKIVELKHPATSWAALLPGYEPDVVELPARLLVFDPEKRWAPVKALLGNFLSRLQYDTRALPEGIFDFANTELRHSAVEEAAALNSMAAVHRETLRHGAAAADEPLATHQGGDDAAQTAVTPPVPMSVENL